MSDFLAFLAGVVPIVLTVGLVLFILLWVLRPHDRPPRRLTKHNEKKLPPQE